LREEHWIEARWPTATGGGPGVPFIAQVFASEAPARDALPDLCELAYVEGDPEPYVTRQVMPLERALEDDPLLLKAWVAYLKGQNDLLRWELEETR